MTVQCRQKPQARTASALLDEMTEQNPNRVAVIDGERRWSYAQLLQESQIVAASLWALGVRPGARVAILMGNRVEWLSSYFGILGLGATAVALNTWLTPAEQAYQLNHAEVSTLILAARFNDRDFVTELEDLRAAGLSSLQRVIVLGPDAPPGAILFSELSDLAKSVTESDRERIWSVPRKEDVAAILYTSGSTAQPKGVPLQHWGLVENMWEIGERMRLSPDDRLWFGVSLFWSFGCVNAVFAVMSHGGSFVLQHHFDAGKALRLIEKEQCTVIYGTPNMARAMLEHPDRNWRDLSSLRTGAAIGSPEQIEMFVALGAHQICNVYGLTEAYGNSCVSDCTAPLEQRLDACGAPLPGVQLQVLDLETGTPLAPGEVGELTLRGRNTQGYLNDPAATAEGFNDEGFLLTGDLGLVDEAGWLHFRGRRKELIKSGGINISPAEIEAVLSRHDAVGSVFVTGLKDPQLDEIVGAVVVPRSDWIVPSGDTADSLREYCRRTLAPYKVPRHIVFVDAADLPVTSTEKLQRNRLFELFSGCLAPKSKS